MNERDQSAVNSAAKEPATVSFAEAARFLGVDTFTFYSIVQREEIPFVFASNGEFVVLQDDLDKLAKENSPC
jgi:hypothetical protein